MEKLPTDIIKLLFLNLNDKNKNIFSRTNKFLRSIFKTIGYSNLFIYDFESFYDIFDLIKNGLCLKYTNIKIGYKFDGNVTLTNVSNFNTIYTINHTFEKEITDKNIFDLTKFGPILSINLSKCSTITDESLKYLTNVSNIDLSDCNITDIGLQSLSKKSTIESINLSYCNQITNSGIKLLIKNNQIKSIKLNGCLNINIKEIGIVCNFIDINLSYSNGLSERTIKDYYLDDNDQFDSYNNENLHNFFLMNNMIRIIDFSSSDADDETLNILTKYCNINSIKIQNCRKITDIGIKILFTKNTIEKINLSNSKITNVGFSIIFANTFVKQINMYGCSQITDQAISKLSNNNCIIKINLGCCNKLTEIGIKILFEKCHKLQSIRLPGYGSTDGIFDLLSSNIKLKNIYLNQCDKITFRGFEKIAKCGTIQNIDLMNCKKINDDVIKILVKHNKDIKKINLQNCSELTSESIKELALNCPIKCINLSGCHNISNLGINALAKFCPMDSINLTYCDNLTNDCFKNLAKCKSLREIYLCNKLISDEGIKSFYNTNINTISIKRCNKITDEGFKSLLSIGRIELNECSGITNKTINRLYKAHQKKGTQYVDFFGCEQVSDDLIKKLGLLI